MSGRQAKKLRQITRRELAAAGLTREQIAETFRLHVRPAPWWFPDRLWTALARVFLAPGSSARTEP